MQKPNTFSWIVISTILLLGLGCNDHSEKEVLPNIIIVLADDLGYGDISIYQPENKIKTPHIDKIAGQGIRFTDAHSPSSVCTPTRYGLLTGRYSWRSRLKSGVLTGKSKALISNSRSTIASMLQDKGYKTAFIGKWHLGWDWAMKNEDMDTGEGWNEDDFVNIDFTKPVKNTPQDLGFNYSYGHSGSLDMAPYVYVENSRVTQIPDSTTVNTGKYSWWRKGPTSKDFVHDDVTPNFFRRSIQFIQEQSKQPNPFFLYLPLPSPHTPILPTAKWAGKSGLNEYGDFMLMIDDYMGQLMSAIEAEGISDNTIVVFTSDNGCSPAAGFEDMKENGHAANGIYRGHKADIYEGGHRVPFVVKWPQKIQGGSISDETICLTDLMATFAEIVDYNFADNEGEDSYSFLPILEGEVLSAPLREATIHHSINGSFAIRKDNWKLIMCAGSGGWSYPKPNDPDIDSLPKVQLYDLSKDPTETNNLEARNPNKVEELKRLLSLYIKQGRSTPGAHQDNDAYNEEWKQIAFIDE